MTKLMPPDANSAPAATDAHDDDPRSARDDSQAWAEAAMRRCSELEKLLRQVVLWFDSPLEAANDDNDTQILGAAVDLNRLIDRAIALLDGGTASANNTPRKSDAGLDDEAPATTPTLFATGGLTSNQPAN